MEPSPNAMSEITEQVPMMMPRTERNERNLWSQRLLMASEMERRSFAPPKVKESMEKDPIRLYASS